MDDQGRSANRARFDTKLPLEQKQFFEYAASLGGFRTLTDFIISSAQEKANEIIKQHNLIIASENDQKIFFEAILKEEEPNTALKNAAKKYQDAIAK